MHSLAGADVYKRQFLFFIYRQRQLNWLVVFYDDLQVIITQFQLISLDGNGTLIGINGVIPVSYTHLVVYLRAVPGGGKGYPCGTRAQREQAALRR